ncbi:hypothetical protein CPB86DRAFT_875041 [Serendipita vermifera]|nr:hypothetical protein CPB86DRAFT_875041 [Serendipita vermifera]
MLSAAISTRHQPANQGKLPSADLLSVTAYPLVSAIDMITRGPLEDRMDDFQIKATFHVVYVASWCSFIYLISTNSKLWAHFVYATMIILMNNVLLGVTCPTSHHGRILCAVVSNVTGILLPLFFIFFWVRFLFVPFWLFASPALLLFAMLHGRMAGPPWLPTTFAPRTHSSISDLDQAAALVIMVLVLLYQWEIWNRISPLIQRVRAFSIFAGSQGNSMPYVT